MHAFALYWAKDENGAWLKVDDETEGILQTDTSVKYVRIADLRPLAGLHDAVTSREIVLHVLDEQCESYRLIENERYQQFVDPYRSVAETLKNTDEVNQLVNTIEDIYDKPCATFIILESSSGMGKTQMAFNLMAHGVVDVIYLVCEAGVERMSEQPIYAAFSLRSAVFRICMKFDLSRVGSDALGDIKAQPDLYTYAFLWALVTGTNNRGRPTRFAYASEALCILSR